MRAACLLFLVACAGPTKYAPRAAAPGELTLSYDSGFKMHAQGREIASGYNWRGLAHFTRCTPRAHALAQKAERDGALAIGMSIAGGVLGGVALATVPVIAVYNDPTVQTVALLSGAGVAILGAVFAGLGRGYKNSANGQAVDAMNHYNDAVGSYGGSCDNPDK